MMKKFAAILLTLSLMMTIAMAAGETVTVAFNPEYPPFEYVEGDQYAGYDVDLINAVAGKAGFCLDPVHWEIRYDIPFLETVTQDRIITREDDTITQYPAYSVEDLIREGKEALEMLRK